ncbi:Predicted ester cyclase [Nocardia otitidiscaviarum]|uniref:Predicted ester cyclase n=1 Tax=Nocardia otitidiscaviarum TaxID=1823 RepID=A0A379JH53_9NOCA|nr:nuclear transport factor 2 family protein [Nocardia otitidiscaviarum]SUD47872.1 Predicted ester cyclase [Nocardia otitidiscaviarum]
MVTDRMFELVRQLATAKGRADVSAALRLMHDDMVLEVPAFGAVVRGRSANETALRWFFATFPDYRVEVTGHLADRTGLVAWGTARMTLTGNGLGVFPTGRGAELPVFLRFRFADDLIVGEYFHFDLAELCAQSGVSGDEVRRHLFRDGR